MGGSHIAAPPPVWGDMPYSRTMRAFNNARVRFHKTAFRLSLKGIDPMSLTTLTLEVRNDFDDPIKHEAMREAVKIAARDLIATACLLQERQVPEITLYENTMEGSTEVDLLEEVDND